MGDVPELLIPRGCQQCAWDGGANGLMWQCGPDVFSDSHQDICQTQDPALDLQLVC